MIKAVLFDMNGIIVDDENVHELAFKETVKPFGINLSHQDYLECCAGKIDRKGYEEIGARFNKSLVIDTLLIEKGEMYLDLFPDNKKSYPGVIELINSLSSEYIIALTSSSSKNEIELITKEFDIYDKFKVIVSANDVSRGKPDPEPYLITSKRLGLMTDECIVIEDSKSGVTSAKSAGCYCIGVTTTHTREDLKSADIIVNTFFEISKSLIDNIVLMGSLTGPIHKPKK